MTDHAPLPWKVLFENGIEAANDTSVVVYAEKEDKNDLCGVRGVTDEEAEANAAFIVEACNNYKELKTALQSILDASNEYEGGIGGYVECLNPRILHARNLLALQKG